MLEAQKHPWFKSLPSPLPTTVPSSILDAMQEFQNYNHLKKAALTAVAYHLNNVDANRGVDGVERPDEAGRRLRVLRQASRRRDLLRRSRCWALSSA